MRSPIRARLAVVVGSALALAVAACSPSATPSPTAPPTPTAASSPSGGATPEPTPTPEPIALTVGLGYIPHVQFAQFYLADQAGYYRDAGLVVTLENKIDPDLITLIGQGAIDIGSADGTSVIPAVSQGIPIVYTATLYGTFPSVVITTDATGIASAADLRGRRIGIPGPFGSSWIMLQALLGSAGLTPDDAEIVPYSDFGQAVALQQGAVDAATGFANNEPIVLEQAGVVPVLLRVDEITPLPGPGLVTSRATLATKRDALAAFVAATLRAMDEIAADPQKGLEAAFVRLPDLAADPALQRKILDATIGTWRNARTNAPFGSIDRAGWQASLEFMTTLGLVPNPVTVDQLVDESLLPAGS